MRGSSVVLLLLVGCGDDLVASDPIDATAAVDGATDGRDGEGVRVTASSPRHDATDVYPAEVHDGTAQRVRITVTFDRAMDTTRATAAWNAVGGESSSRSGTWSIDAHTFTLDLIAPPFSGQRPLDDLTTYEIDLEALRDRGGAEIVPDVGLTARRFRFTTGTYDPLLNHSCGHVFFGPFASVIAAAAPGPAITRSDTAHTRYTVSLPGSPHAGFTRYRPVGAATVHLFLDGDLALEVSTLDGTAIPTQRVATPAACVGISTRLSFQTESTETLFLRFGPQLEPETRFIVEVENP